MALRASLAIVRLPQIYRSAVDNAGGGRRGLRPMLTPPMAEAVQRTWGVDVGAAVPLGGSTGLNLVAQAGPRPVVVRVHRRHVSASRVEALQVAREACAGAGVPTARAIVGSHGERHVTVDSCVIEVEPFVESDAKMDTLGRIRHAMPMLGRLHDALAASRLPDAADDLRFGNYLSVAEVTARTAQGAARIRTLDTSLQEVVDAAEALARRVIEAEGGRDPLPGQWCHGDYWDNNVLFRNNEIVLVADFGFMNRRPRVDDLALTVYFTLYKFQAAGHEDPLGTLSTLADAYDRGTQRPLSDREREALPVAVARQPLWSIGVWAAQLDDPEAVVAHLHGHEGAIRLGARMLEHADAG